MNRLWLSLALIAAALVLAANTFFVVGQRDQALVLELGRAVRTENVGLQGRPGLKLKVPFIQDRVLFDKRNLGVTLEGNDPIVASDQQRLVVDAFARYRISDPLTFYQKLQNEDQAEQRLRVILNGTLRRVLASVPASDIVSGKRAELLQAITQNMQVEAKDLGLQIIDVRIRQADLPDAVEDQVFARMRTDREKVAAQIRAEGAAQATRIRAEADREATIIRATAKEQADATRGQGDAERARIFAQSFGKDPEFAAFYRSMQAYDQTLQEGTPVLVTPDSEFFKYLRNKDAR